MGGETKHNRRKAALYALGLIGGLFAVAMWGKMRFVTDLPRMAYAVPEEEIAQSQAELSHPNADDADDESAQKPDQEREPDQAEMLDLENPESGGF